MGCAWGTCINQFTTLLSCPEDFISAVSEGSWQCASLCSGRLWLVKSNELATVPMKWSFVTWSRFGLSSISSRLSSFLLLLFFFLQFFTDSYVRCSSTHWTVNSGNWLVGVWIVEPHILNSLATNPQRTWGLLGAYPTAGLCLLLKCHSKVCVLQWACWCPLLLTQGEGLGVLIPSQLSFIVISLGTGTCYILTTVPGSLMCRGLMSRLHGASI